MCWKCLAKHAGKVGKGCDLAKRLGRDPVNTKIPVIVFDHEDANDKLIVRCFCWKCIANHSRPAGKDCKVAEDKGKTPLYYTVPKINNPPVVPVSKIPEKPAEMDAPVTTGALAEAVRSAIQEALVPVNQELKDLREGRTATKENGKKSEASGKKKKSSKKGKSTESVSNEESVIRELRTMGVPGSTDDSEEWDEEGTSTTEQSTSESSSPVTTPTKRTRRRKKSKKAGKKLKKSGRELTMETCHRHPIPWPHFYVHDSKKMKGARYDDLTLGQFVYGFDKQMEDPRWASDLKHMRRYQSAFLEDVKDFEENWTNLRDTHAAILTFMEQGSVKWSNKRHIDRIRTRYIYNVLPALSCPEFSAAARQMTPCPAYQTGTCPREGSHSGLVHMCANCWRSKRKVFRHPEKDCYSANKNRSGQ